MKKIISFSLWGENPRYLLGALQNIQLAAIYYPTWICRFYIHRNVSTNLINKIYSYANTEIKFFENRPDWSSTLFRFLPALDENVSIFISRDADSRLSQREKAAVEAWEMSNQAAHIMRDHPYHARPIMAGMWGLKKGWIKNMDSLIDDWAKGNDYECDQKFLRAKIYPLIKESAMVHDEFFEKKPFPEKSGIRVKEFFVGQAYDGYGNILDTQQYGKDVSYIKHIKLTEGVEIDDSF